MSDRGELDVVRGALPAVSDAERAELRRLANRAIPDSTRRTYDYWWDRWLVDAAARGVAPLGPPPEAFAAFLRGLLAGGARVSTLQVVRAAIARFHRVARVPSPTSDELVRLVVAGARHDEADRGIADREVEPAVVSILVRLLPRGDRLIDVRDRALFLVGFVGALRREELARLEVDRVIWSDAGLILRLGRSKTDQDARRDRRAIPRGETDPALCPVAALRLWLDRAGHTAGPLFRAVDRHGNVGGRISGHAIAQRIKHHAAIAGLDPNLYSGHSLRAGFVTEAYDRGRTEADMMEQTGHTSSDMLRRYRRRSDRFVRNAARGLL